MLVELTKKPANPLIHAIEMSKSNKTPFALIRRPASRSLVGYLADGINLHGLQN
jgi:hypothetical protein